MVTKSVIRKIINERKLEMQKTIGCSIQARKTVTWKFVLEYVCFRIYHHLSCSWWLLYSTYKLTGCPRKMSVYKKVAQITNGHFFWDTWYMVIGFNNHPKNLLLHTSRPYSKEEKFDKLDPANNFSSTLGLAYLPDNFVSTWWCWVYQKLRL